LSVGLMDQPPWYSGQLTLVSGQLQIPSYRGLTNPYAHHQQSLKFGFECQPAFTKHVHYPHQDLQLHSNRPNNSCKVCTPRCYSPINYC